MASDIGRTGVTLTWNDDPPVAEERYKVEYSTNGSDFNTWAILPASTVTYEVNGLTPASEFWFRVEAWNTNPGNCYLSHVVHVYTTPTVLATARGTGRCVSQMLCY